MILIEIIWELSPLFIAIIVYIVSITGIAQLSIRYPFLEKLAVWGFKLMPSVAKFLGKNLLDNMSRKIQIVKPEISINKTKAYPSILFEFTIDNDASIKFKPIELTAYVYLESAFMGKIHWSRNEELEKNKVEIVNPSIAKNYEFDEVPDVEAIGESKIRLQFTPPLELFEAKYLDKWHYLHQWHLEIFIKFSTRLGDIFKKYSQTFIVNKNDLEEASKRFSL